MQVVARELGVTTPEGISRLEDQSIFGNTVDPAETRVRNGSNVQDVARRAWAWIGRGANEQVVVRTAGVGVLNGENVRVVAREFGITTLEGIRSLELASISSDAPNSAGFRVRYGANVQVVAQELGITTPESIRLLAIQSPTALAFLNRPRLPGGV